MRPVFSKQQVPSFRLGEEGIYIVFLAILIIPLLFMIGMAVDSAQLEIDALRVQRAADVAAVSGTSMIGELSNPEIIQIAQQVARDNYDRNGLYYENASLDSFIAPSFLNDNTLTVSAHSDSQTYIIGRMIEGKDLWDIHGLATGQRRPVELVLVADVTGSMGGSVDGVKKIDALKSAAKKFVDVFSEKSDFIGLVSYSTGLNKTGPMYERYREHNYPIGIDYHSDPQNPSLNLNFSKDNLNAAIDTLPATGRTNIQSGMIGGIDEIFRLEQIIGEDMAKAYLRVIVLMTDGSPNEHTGDIDNSADPDKPIQDSSFPGTCVNDGTGDHQSEDKQDFIYPLLLADWARQQGILVFTIGLGNPAPADSNQPFYQGGNDSYLRSYFLRRMGNAPSFPRDPQTNEPIPDPELPEGCLDSYENMADYARGEYLESPDPNELDDMLQRVARSIQCRLIE